jgi:hypothetical protein
VPPASTGHIHNTYAMRERTSSTGSVGYNPGEQKRQGPSSPRCTDIRDGRPSLTGASEESVHGEHQVRRPDRIVSPSPTEVARDGLYDAYAAGTEREGRGPVSRNADQRPQQPTRSFSVSGHSSNSFSNSSRGSYHTILVCASMFLF